MDKYICVPHAESPDQEVRYFSIRTERVARYSTITDVLEKLLYAAAYLVKTSPDHEVALHTC